MRIAIAGGTGFVGNALVKKLLEKKHEIFILTRNISHKQHSKNLNYVQWLNDDDSPEDVLESIDVFINLAGESINSGRWTEDRKKRILNSRITATKEVRRIISRLEEKPYTLINASAVGYYGTSQVETFTESSRKSGTDFLAETVRRWEEEAAKAEEFEVRTVFCRFGIILEKNDGALPRMALPYKLFAGGTVGSGSQWVSWIHLDDAVSGILFCIEHEQLHGPVNFTSPYPVTMKEFGQILGEVLNRPHWMPAPGFALKIALGEMSTLVLEGQKVLPEKLQSFGYEFLYPELKAALSDIYK
ncbi:MULTISPECIES: TIGR01777 family oxidoreductase [Cytobacillus]|uniref:TIGR01777 family protein n=2 Tax=Cytobacillus TaxID=2675230 RepID=A0ABX3CYU6_9BACI|nr:MULTISPECIES: TIGR01777 family oxidoreductase [Cytobacillus]EFV74901.1 cell-division inhibitor [Bacillus sp. 2_A_57_CT2]MBU8729899.1 TIGR01777 family oxidoreductase [Cytobacillus oceanisediminis]MCM3405855.1 TIGR01777 family oxidoreductase [Cytobacillus oceanisediminis]MDK7666724.1 TIGR01777 family oxidoreductase [Cytobacillus oceanisediminis]OHX50524.1 TIGR01777 family protein [Cytobacillus oceanisediminis]